MNYNEEELIKQFGDEKLLKKYRQYVKDREIIEKQLEQLPEDAKTEKYLFDLSSKYLELDFAFNFILSVLLKSNILTPELMQGIDLIKQDKRFFT